MHNTQGAGFVRREGGAKRVLMLRLEFALKWQLTRLWAVKSQKRSTGAIFSGIAASNNEEKKSQEHSRI